MQLVEGEAGGCAAESDAGALGGEDGVVEVVLGGREGAGDGPGAGYVGDVISDFLRRWGISLWDPDDEEEKGKEIEETCWEKTYPTGVHQDEITLTIQF